MGMNLDSGELLAVKQVFSLPPPMLNLLHCAINFYESALTWFWSMT